MISNTTVPPPTRRCTAAADRAAPGVAGSSAHAEMHPRPLPRPHRRAGFLRPRGDAPDHSLGVEVCSPVPPPTRRCTLREQRRARERNGSSAHAEMHPRVRAMGLTRSGFLRPRGDAPRTLFAMLMEQPVPPPTRRCTLRAWRPAARGCGSSAHAEMHPRRHADRVRLARFLRPRGDAPYIADLLSPVVSVPPPTRRCTQCGVDGTRTRAGSSAHAEMHPRPGRMRAATPRFLRPRGDAPSWPLSGVHVCGVPPPTRRCTVRVRRERRRRTGSSAHAEMHPARAPCGPSS